MEKTELEKLSGVQNIIGTTTINGFLFEIYGTVENPLFLAKDIATVLEHSHVPTMMQSVDDEEKLMCTILTSGQRREMNCVTEGGFYELMMLSRKPIAKEFKKGVKKVLHELRTKGEVKIGFNIPQTFSQALMLAAKQAEQIEQQNKLIEVKDTQILELKPKATYYDTILSSKKAECISVFSKSDYGISGMAMNKLLHDWGIQYKVGKTWLPYQKYASLGYTKTETITINEDKDTVIQTKWTQQGRLFIYEEMKKHGYFPLIEK